MSDLIYEQIAVLDVSELQSALTRDDPDELSIAALSAALYAPDPAYAEDLCVRLANHEHFNVRGNALLGFAHLARIDNELNEAKIKPFIVRGLRDEHEYVRGQALNAKEDIEHYLGWKF